MLNCVLLSLYDEVLKLSIFEGEIFGNGIILDIII